MRLVVFGADVLHTNTIAITMLWPVVKVVVGSQSYLHGSKLGFFPPYLARVNTALVFRHFLADVRPLHTSPTYIISSLDQLSYLTQLKAPGLSYTRVYSSFLLIHTLFNVNVQYSFNF